MSDDKQQLAPVFELPTRHTGFYNEGNDSGGGGGDLETRVAKLESDVEHIRSDISDIKTDIREIRKDNQEMKDALSDIKVGLASNRAWYVTTATGLAIAAFTFARFL
ncbi:hypothetical protein HMF8227_01467 [Saliniradius amylolyticus]|uniref:Uncharacterized protein n=1 Tax=Saliniradius amylolyticus TaxID=2183582 RepID=A0A2S2E344_9ALTE|nr:hypothetical protein [Saliniradius amylolyticus]AWL11942.1 hypothetical protein HMF8227_01467 [Saliniradius amylolyticus]